jgi:hypothetical protein
MESDLHSFECFHNGNILLAVGNFSGNIIIIVNNFCYCDK